MVSKDEIESTVQEVELLVPVDVWIEQEGPEISSASVCKNNNNNNNNTNKEVGCLASNNGNIEGYNTVN